MSTLKTGRRHDGLLNLKPLEIGREVRPDASAQGGRSGVQAARGLRILLTHQFTTRLMTVLG